MLLEAAIVFDVHGTTLYRHIPQGRSSGAIPDSRALWEWLERNVDQVLGIAHLHPFPGPALPSWEDLTTFSAVELGLDKRLVWPIVTTTTECDTYVHPYAIGSKLRHEQPYQFVPLSSSPDLLGAIARYPLRFDYGLLRHLGNPQGE